jgi:hypothetical protein
MALTNTMTRPLLTGIIQPEDIFFKGKYQYVSWAKIANYLHEHAKGWDFHLELPPESPVNPLSNLAVWKAPDETGFLMGYFTDPEGNKTSSFPYPIMDNRNNPIKWDKISSRDITDSHRRALCACAAFTFSLGSELWTGNEIVGSKETKSSVKDRTPVSTQNLTVVAKDAILKADTRERLDKCAESLEVRYANRQIPQEDYLDLCELIKTRKEVITT